MKNIIVSIFILFNCFQTFGQNNIPVSFIDSNDYKLISDNILYWVDSSDSKSPTDLDFQNFTTCTEKVLNLDIQTHAVWMIVEIGHADYLNECMLEIENANLDTVELYELNDSGFRLTNRLGDRLNFHSGLRYRNDPFPVFKIDFLDKRNKILLFRIKNSEPLIVPLYLGTVPEMDRKIDNRVLFFGVYTGILVVMILYNLFIFISLRSRIYFSYVIYICLVYLAQSTFVGYSEKYLFAGLPGIAHIGSFIFPAFVIMLGLYFISEFLNISKYTPRVKYVFMVFGFLCVISIFSALSGLLTFSFYLLQPVAGISALFILAICTIHIKKGNRQGSFMLVAWSFFFIGVIVWVLKNLNILEHNFVTNYSMTIGSALETVLLSFALADRINTLKKEREESQRQMLDEMRKNRDLTENLNRELEQKVAERTQTLEITNRDLQDTLANLKSTQSQLLEAEKMASLGQLTAGIAHEINNPINFVSSNVEPLRNDFKDVLQILNQYQHYAKDKEDPALAQILSETDELDLEYSINEISQLIDGIEEGAKRTSEIVTGLKNFSRTDEEDLKKSDINEGLRSTITILKSQLRSIKVNVDYGEIPYINCQLGKLNQVFMNIIDNSIDAIEDKYGESLGGVLSVRTNYADGIIRIEIGDNGNGIPDDVKKHIFDPFFTTKDVGKGTGLGLSISYGIIEKHNGSIEVHGESGVGTTFIITIPDDLKTNNGEQG